MHALHRKQSKKIPEPSRYRADIHVAPCIGLSASVLCYIWLRQFCSRVSSRLRPSFVLVVFVQTSLNFDALFPLQITSFFSAIRILN